MSVYVGERRMGSTCNHSRRSTGTREQFLPYDWWSPWLHVRKRCTTVSSWHGAVIFFFAFSFFFNADRLVLLREEREREESDGGGAAAHRQV